MIESKRSGLSGEEKKEIYYRKAIRTLGVFNIIGGIMGVVSSIFIFSKVFSRDITSDGLTGILQAWGFLYLGIFLLGSLIPLVIYINNYTVPFLLLPLALFYIYFGISLIRFRKWCYAAGGILYSLTIILYVLYWNTFYFSFLFPILFISYIISKTSKKILVE